MSRRRKKTSPSVMRRVQAIEAEDGPQAITEGGDAGIAKRRERVWHYMLRGVPRSVIASLLQTSMSTIYQDMVALRSAAGAKMRSTKGNVERTFEEIGLTSARVGVIATEAMAQYQLADSAVAKDRFLNTALKAEWVRARVLMETGIIPRAGEEIKVTTKNEVTFTQRFGDNSPLSTLDDPASRRKVLQAVEDALRNAQATKAAIEAANVAPRPAPLPPMITVQAQPSQQSQSA